MIEAIPVDLLRSLLFVPVLQERFVASAYRRGADAIILDLEDSVAPSAKDRARAELGAAAKVLSEARLTVFVRVNSSPADVMEKDIAAAAAARVHGIVVPKVETPDDLGTAINIAAAAERRERHGKPRLEILLLIETPLGLVNAPWLCKGESRVAGYIFGSEDFAAGMGIPPHETAMRLPAQQVAIAAKAHGLPALGLPGSIALIDDQERFRTIVTDARAIGLSGSPCIHPRQVQILNELFGATAGEVAEAKAIVQAYEAAVARDEGAISLNGRMIDVPVYQRAVTVLRRARRHDDQWTDA